MRTPLRIELFVRGINLAKIARRAGVDPAFVSRVVAGKQKCSTKLAKALSEFGIQVDSLDTRKLKQSK
jgi:plasmid maintenance system antidote protein VapI